MEIANILLVEDNPGDVHLIRKAFENARIVNELHVVGDGVAALDFLHRRAAFENAPMPHLVLLDLNLPKKDGREVLAELKSHPTLRRIPVIVMTSSSAEADILRSYEMHANSFITKPPSLIQLQSTLQALHSYWFAIVRLPDCRDQRNSDA